MTTNGIISIVKNDETIMKIIAGCDGYNAETTAKEIIEFMKVGGDPTNLQDIFDIAIEKKFGCKDCLTVMNKTDSLSEAQSEEPREYRETFEDPQFNPRNRNGHVGHLFIIPALE